MLMILPGLLYPQFLPLSARHRLQPIGAHPRQEIGREMPHIRKPARSIMVMAQLKPPKPQTAHLKNPKLMLFFRVQAVIRPHIWESIKPAGWTGCREPTTGISIKTNQRMLTDYMPGSKMSPQ